MTAAHSADAGRRAEDVLRAALPPGTLMARAAAGLAAVLLEELRARRGRVVGARVVLLVGPGDNGGDALLAGARLQERGVVVTALTAAARTHPGALATFTAAGGRLVPAPAGGPDPEAGSDPAALDGPTVAALSAADAVVDGLLGTGARPGLRGRAAALVAALPPGVPVVAVDLPSGVDTATGETPGPHAVATTTVTMGAAKPALLLPPAAAAAGRVRLVELHLPAAELGAPVVTRLDAAAAGAAWPRPGGPSDKYSRGVVGVVAGGDQYTGAAVLCTGAAVHAGAGMVRFVGLAHPSELVRARWPEVVPGSGRVQAWVVGPGLDLDAPANADAARAALAEAAPPGAAPPGAATAGSAPGAADEEGPAPVALLVDAGALPLVAARIAEHGSFDPARHRVLLTPHAGELARLLQTLLADPDPDARPSGAQGAPSRADVEARPLHHARLAAALTGASVLLKGATTLVVDPPGPGGAPGPVRSQADGPAWLATAGSGDVLAGVAGTLLAAGLAPGEAGALAAAVHGRAARAANPDGPVHAGAVSAAVPGVVAALLRVATPAAPRAAHRSVRRAPARRPS